MEKIQAAFKVLNPEYIVHKSTVCEILFIKERDFHRSPSCPTMPRPTHPASWEECSLNTAEKQVSKIKSAAKNLKKALDDMKQPTIYAFAHNGLYFAELEKMLISTMQAAENANKSIDKWKPQYPEWVSKRTGQPRKEVAFHIAMILAEEYHRATGKNPTIITDSYGFGHPASGNFINLIKNIFEIVSIKASPEAMARDAIKLWNKRKKLQDKAFKELSLSKTAD